MFQRAAEINPEDYQAPLFTAQALKALDRTADAKQAYRRTLDVIERHLELNPDDARAIYLGAAALIYLDERDKALEWARKASVIDPHNPATLYNVACAYSQLGEIERAIDCLEESVVNGMSEIGWLDNDPDLDALRDEPRFRELLEDVRKRSTSSSSGTESG